MKKLMILTLIVMAIVLTILWGALQPLIFTEETFGCLFIITSFLGGYFIGVIFFKIYYILVKNKVL